ncbi:MAG: C10 family peptidase, partial [Marinoscillum sp.]
GRPVILRACREREKKGFIITWYVYDGCHAWVADGIRITNYETYSTYQVHMNWGWGSRGGNGWFVSWNVSGRNYQYVKKMIINIHP